MYNGHLADLDMDTITALSGMPLNKDMVNPKRPEDMAEKVRVTFRPLPEPYYQSDIVNFRRSLLERLKKSGVEVVPWDEATSADTSNGMLSRIFSSRKVKRNISAVVDVKREQSSVMKLLSGIAESIYGLVRNSERSVMSIIKISGWADDFTAKHVQDPFNTQVITLTNLNPEFEDKSTTYDRKIVLGLNNLISTMSEIVIGVSDRRFTIVNMNLSDSLYVHEELDDFVSKSLIPKIYAPIKPPVLNRFIQGEFDSESNEYSERLCDLGKILKETELFPKGSKFSDKIRRRSHRDIVNKILDGRTGVSYGFIALAEVPRYFGPKRLDRSEWDGLDTVDGMNGDYVRKNSEGRWYVKTRIKGEVVYQQVPDIRVVTSRSGCDKTSLDPKTDIVRVGLIKGKLYLEVPSGINLSRRDVRPSFDTYVILAQALSASLYTPELIKDGMPILHFHGYPDPDWFCEKEYHSGANNPSLPCGTIEAAILNYSAIYEIASNNSGDANLICLVESDHGVNIMGPDKEYIVDRLKSGRKSGKVILGGEYLPLLKSSTPVSAHSDY